MKVLDYHHKYWKDILFTLITPSKMVLAILKTGKLWMLDITFTQVSMSVLSHRKQRFPYKRSILDKEFVTALK